MQKDVQFVTAQENIVDIHVTAVVEGGGWKFKMIIIQSQTHIIQDQEQLEQFGFK